VHVTLSGLFVYPVKGARGIALDAAQIEPRGIAGDRRYMIVDTDGVFVTQREEGRLAQLTPSFDADGALRLAMDGVGEVRAPHQPAQALRSVRVWSDHVDARDLGPEPARFLSEALGRPLSLVYMEDAYVRAVQPAYAEPGDRVGFADAFPFLLTGEASLADLNAKLGSDPVPMARFRPNLVVTGGAAFAEDGWSRIALGGLPFEVRKPCTRCVVITRDQRTGESVGKEPLRTLSRYRTWQNKPIFGQNLLVRGSGTLRLGAALAVLAERAPDGTP